MRADLFHGDCLDMLRGLSDDSVDSIVTDPPYGIAFMGRRWDYDVPTVEVWAECLRVLKPGGHLLAFASTRTQHRMAVRIEDAGFEIRDMLAWVYGSGFPKSLDVSKAIDKAAGAARQVVGTAGDFARDGAKRRSDGSHKIPHGSQGGHGFKDRWSAHVTAPATEQASAWEGWGTALKPALEPITMARKPLASTVAENVTRHGTGAINIDGCRVATGDALGGGQNSATTDRGGRHEGYQRPWEDDEEAREASAERSRAATAKAEALGRWPANMIHDGSDEVVALFPAKAGAAAQATGPTHSGYSKSGSRAGAFHGMGDREAAFHGDSGSAARFFYCAKVKPSERHHGMPEGEKNTHPTVKPTDLMRYLCRLVTPPGGTVLDPFMGSGSTGRAAILEGFSFIGAELEAQSVGTAAARIRAIAEDAPLLAAEVTVR